MLYMVQRDKHQNEKNRGWRLLYLKSNTPKRTEKKNVYNKEYIPTHDDSTSSALIESLFPRNLNNRYQSRQRIWNKFYTLNVRT